MLRNRIELAKYFNELGFKTGAEIGVLFGYYSEVLQQNISGLKLYCIDNWEIGKTYPTYKQAKERLAPYNCELIRKTSMDAVKLFDNETLDFVFIDGAHDYEHVKEDIEAWYKKVRVGGIVAGHDYYYMKHIHKDSVIRAVNEFVEANNLQLHLTELHRSDRNKDNWYPCWYVFRA